MIELYKTYYKLKRDPFRLSPDQNISSYVHPTYKKSLAYLKFAAYREEGFVMITGRPGTGKTTLINEIVSTVDPAKVHISTLVSTQLEATDLLAVVANSFNIHTTSEVKSTLLLQIEKYLRFRAEEGVRVILIVDEAQGLCKGAVEELRLLSNMTANNRPLLQIFLVGQDQLKGLVRSPDMEQLRQRLIATSFLMPLTAEEVEEYVRHRLNEAGWVGDPAFEKAAIMLVHHYSGGIPRKINLICGRLLLNGCMEKKHTLTRADMESVVQELRNELLIFDEEILPEIDDTDDEVTGFLEPLVEPQKNTAVESVPESATVSNAAGISVEEPAGESVSIAQTSAAAPGVEENRQVPAAAKTSVTAARTRQKRRKPAAARIRKKQRTPVAEKTLAAAPAVEEKQQAPAAEKTPVAVLKTGENAPGVTVNQQPVGESKSARRRRERIRLLLAGGVLLCALALFTVKLMSEYGSTAVLQEADNITGQVAERVEAIAEYYGASVARLAKDPDISVFLLSGNVEALKAKEKSFGYVFSNAINVQLLPAGLDQVDEESTPPLSYAALAQMRAAESSEGAQRMEIHLFNTPQQHVSIMRRVMAPDGKKVVGHVRLSLLTDVLQDAVQAPGQMKGYFEIQQVGPMGDPLAILTSGDRGSADDTAEQVIRHINGTSWRVVYWPVASWSGYLSGGGLWGLGTFALLLSVVLMLAALVLIRRR